MKTTKTLLVAAALLLAPRAALAGPPALAMTDRDDANACLPLGDGGLAVATGGGLVVLGGDGVAQVLTALDGLPGTRVYAIAREGDALWVGTEGGAALVALARSPTITRTLVLGDAAVRAVLPVSGGVYLGTWGSGVMHLASRQDAAVVVPASVTGTHVAALAEHRGALYVAYADGPLAVIDRGVLRQAATEPAHGQALASVPGHGESTLLLGDLEGLFAIAGSARTPGSVDVRVDARALASSDAGLLVGTFGSGLLSGPAPGALHEEAGVPRFVRGVAALGRTRCVATTEGVFVEEGESGWRKVPLGGPPSNDITALAAADGRVAIGTFDRGAATYERGTFRTVPALASNETVEALAWQGHGARARLLLGTARGLVRVEPDGTTRRFEVVDGLPSSRVRSLLVLSDDRVLAGTDDGAVLVEGDRVTPIGQTHKGRGPRPLESPMHATWALAASDDGTLWIGTTTGLYYGREGRFRRAAVASGELADDWVTALAVQGADVFVGTYSGGVAHLRVHGDTLAPSQLGGGYVNPGGLAIVGGELLAATMEGLLTRPATDDRGSWQLRADASPGRDVTAVGVVEGALWVASRRGIGVSQ